MSLQHDVLVSVLAHHGTSVLGVAWVRPDTNNIVAVRGWRTPGDSRCRRVRKNQLPEKMKLRYLSLL